MFQIPAKESKDFELLFQMQETISNGTNLELNETLIKAFLENSIIQLSFRISEQNVAVYKSMKTGVKMCKLPKYSPKNLICFPNEKTNFFLFGNPNSIFMKVLYHAWNLVRSLIEVHRPTLYLTVCTFFPSPWLKFKILCNPIKLKWKIMKAYWLK